MALSLQECGLREAVSGSRVLVVGAGGIGCELIKDLVLTGFNDLVIVGDHVTRPRDMCMYQYVCPYRLTWTPLT